MESLTIALGGYRHSDAVLDGRVPVPGYVVKPVEVRPIIAAYRRMIRDLEFDVCELAPVSYLMAREAGVPLTAIPVFLNRRFHHGDVQCSPTSGITAPRDLEGRRVGVRAYSVSTGVWARGVLEDDYGVDLSQVTWVVDDDDHVEGRAPANVERVRDDRSLSEHLAADEIDAAFTGNAGTGRAGNPKDGWESAAEAAPATYPLFANREVIERDHYLRTGIYPLHSIVAVRSELVEQDPDLPTRLYAAFAEAKQITVAEDPEFTALPRLARQGAMVGGDPIPYGITANASSVAALQRFSKTQGLIDTEPGEDPFAPGDYPDS